MTSRRVKSVSLQDRHYEIAERMPNFSAFVQDALDSYAANIGQGHHTQSPENRMHGEKCNPMGAQFCKVCWPDGRPSRDDWFKYSQDPSFPITASEAGRYKQFIQQAFAYNEPKQKSGDTISDDVKQFGIIRRFWRWIF